MIKNFLIVVGVVVVTAGLTVWLDAVSRPSVVVHDIPGDSSIKTRSAPDFSVTAVDGRNVRLADLKGRIVVLNFWASWCVPCVKEFPLLMEVAERYSSQVTVLALSSDFKTQDIERFLDQKAPGARDIDNFIIALDEKSAITADLFQTLRLPETIIIDRDGNMRNKLVGANWTMEDVDAIVQALSP